MNDSQKDRRPDIAQDDQPKVPTDIKDSWKNAEETLGEGAAPDPSAEKRSRTSG